MENREKGAPVNLLNKSDVALLVMSCDAFQDIWEGFSVCIKKFWPNCPFSVYLSTEKIAAPESLCFEKTLFSNAENWSGRLLDSLKQIKDPFIFFVLDDMWLTQSIDDAAMANAVRLLRQDDIGVIRLSQDSVKKKEYTANPDYLEVPFGEPYRLNTGPALWKKEYLISVLDQSESAWEFERVGSFRKSGKSHKVLYTKQALYEVLGQTGAVERGQYEPFTISFANNHQINLNLSVRKVKSKRYIFFKALRTFIFHLCPKGIVLIQNAMYHYDRKRKMRKSMN